MNNKLIKKLIIDEYFGIYNRNGFEYTLENLQDDIPFKLYLLDFDNIKQMNETIGYKSVNNIFKNTFEEIIEHPGIIVGRAFSGDEIFICDTKNNINIIKIENICSKNKLTFKYIEEFILSNINIKDKLNSMIDNFHKIKIHD